MLYLESHLPPHFVNFYVGIYIENYVSRSNIKVVVNIISGKLYQNFSDFQLLFLISLLQYII